MIGRWATAGGMVAILLLTGCAEPPPAPPPEAVVELVDWRTVPALAPEAERADYIWVDKSERLMILYRGADELRRYRIALGAAPAGHKFRQGDERTPTGRYRIEWRNANSIAHLSLRISYPNAVDLARAAAAGVDPGGDIMIHGLMNGYEWVGERHTATDWTNGCIAVTSEEVREIWALVPDGTIIDIFE